MSENKLDRANLRRQAQRVESYKSLIFRHRSTLKRDNSLETSQKAVPTKCSFKEFEDEENGKCNQSSSPENSIPSCSTDSFPDHQPNLCTSLKTIQDMPYQNEQEMSSVMTRSATRKYASVGAIHNRVDTDKEFKMIKLWPSNIAYPVPNPPDNLMQLRDLVAKSFLDVLAFCKIAVTPKCEEPQTVLEDNYLQPSYEVAGSFIDLSPYLSQEPDLDSTSNKNSITFQLNEDYIAHPFVSIIPVNEDDQVGTLVIHEEEEDYETITLHSDESYLIDNKYFPNSTSFEFNSSGNISSPNNFPDDPMLAVYNDHTYAAKPNKKVVITEPEPPQRSASPMNQENEFKLQNALNDLLLNTAILKCLVCNETPQEIISQLEMAQLHLYSDN